MPVQPLNFKINTMIKLLLTTTTVIATCATLQVNAQIQNMNPSAGDVFNYEYFDLTVADSGSVGNNQTWDFSGAVSTEETGSKTYRALTTQEQVDFPTANLAYTEGSDATVYLMNANADSLTELGDTEFLFDNPIVLYKYPIGGYFSFTDNAGVSQPPLVNIYGSVQTFTQGTGTLITPFGTYENVMKVRKKGNMHVTIAGTNEEVLLDSYIWINPDNKTELLTIESTDYVNDTEQDEMFAFFLKNGAFASVNEIEKNIFSLYPNPANDVVYLKSASETPDSYEIYSVAGVLVQSGKYAMNQGISTENLQVGEYILKATTSNGTMSHVKFSKI